MDVTLVYIAIIRWLYWGICLETVASEPGHSAILNSMGKL